jgi:hypothetical protein
MNDIREALREGLREEASPISRRLAEVKGLSNNTVRRLEGIEQTLASEREARIDDLTLLVELLTEGWRSLNTKLDRIETALDRPANVVPLRNNVALAGRQEQLEAGAATDLGVEVEPPAEHRR